MARERRRETATIIGKRSASEAVKADGHSFIIREQWPQPAEAEPKSHQRVEIIAAAGVNGDDVSHHVFMPILSMVFIVAMVTVAITKLIY